MYVHREGSGLPVPFAILASLGFLRRSIGTGSPLLPLVAQVFNLCAKGPLAEDAALEWVCGEVERTDEGAPSDTLKAHLTTMLAHAGSASWNVISRGCSGSQCFARVSSR